MKYYLSIPHRSEFHFAKERNIFGPEISNLSKQQFVNRCIENRKTLCNNFDFIEFH